MPLKIEDNEVRKVTLEDGVTDVVIPDGITAICGSAFAGCHKMTSVTIPDSVTGIEFAVFINCYNLTKLYLPDSVTYIGIEAFRDCDKLVTNRPIKQWENRYGLKKLIYALNYMRYYQSGDPFFDDVKAENDKYIKSQRELLIRKMTADDTAAVTYIMRETRLSVDDIDYLLKLFSENVEITAMLLDHKSKYYTDEYLQKLEADKFEKEAGIKERTLSEWRRIYLLDEDDEQGGYAVGKYKGTSPDVIIPDHIAGKPVTRIGRCCYSPNSFRSLKVIPITSIYIPDTVTCIEAKAFKECSLLTEITIPNSVVSIGKTAFEFCSKLAKVTLSESLVSIPKELFSCCQSLYRIRLPKSLKYIGENAFNSCTKLTEITIPKGITSIESSTFENCKKLERVNLPDGLARIEKSAFSECTVLHEITIPASVTFIDHTSFENTNDLIITAPHGSYAIEYAREQGFKFKELPI